MYVAGLNTKDGQTLRRRLARTANRGLTLIEAAMVLAILALVVAGIMLFYQNANTSRQTTNALNDLAAVQQQVRSLYGGQPSFAGITPELIANSKALPARMVSGTTLRHSFNGQILIAPANAGGGAGSGFQVTFQNIPQEACVKMLSSDLGRGLYAAGVNAANRTQTQGLPFPLDQANAACAAANNNVVWIFT